jgi:hypothetical protein
MKKKTYFFNIFYSFSYTIPPKTNYLNYILFYLFYLFYFVSGKRFNFEFSPFLTTPATSVKCL